MHNDEAVNSVKFGTLLETGNFTYDQEEYHGPVLYYLTLIPAWISGTHKFQNLHEWQLRMVPAIAGIGLLLLLLSLRRITGWQTVLAISLIGAISPAMVFFSRYYIHEMLLILFTYGFIFSVLYFLKNRQPAWLLMSGAFLGLMFVTKETFIFVATALILAIVVEQFSWKNRFLYWRDVMQAVKWHHYLIFFGLACIISILFYSSFFQNPQGIFDSVTTYKAYFTKAGVPGSHWHPWYYYLKILAWNRGPGWIIWTELPVLILAFLGTYQACTKRNTDETDKLFRIVALFTMILMLIYSIIPYKTPWNMLNFYFGMIMMAGYAVVQLAEGIRKGWLRYAFWVIMSGIFLCMIGQTSLSNYKLPADPSNPYVYGHTGMDIFKMIERISDVAVFHPEGNEIYIQVICSGNDYWPLPWYLRDYKNVGWWDHVDTETPLAPLIIASPDLEEHLIDMIYTRPLPGEKYLYVPLFEEHTELRPGVEIKAFVRQDYRRY